MSTQNSNRPDNKNDMGPKFDFGKNKFALFFIVSLIIMFGIILFSNSSGVTQEVPYSTFLNYVESGQVSSVEILDTSDVYFTLDTLSNTGTALRYSTRIPYFDDELMQNLLNSGTRVTGSIKGTSAIQIILQLLPWMIFIGFFWMMYK